MINQKSWLLFKDMLFISAFTFGGGFTIVSLMKDRFVDERNWISDEEMLDIIMIAESTPGAIAVNAAILVGYKISGIKGIFISVLGTIIPPILIIIVISRIYNAFISNSYIKYLLDGIKAGVAAIIINSSVNLGSNFIKNKNYVSILIFSIAFTLIFVLKVNVIYVLLVSIFLGMLQTMFFRKEVNGK